jgi:hypothetical protein
MRNVRMERKELDGNGEKTGMRGSVLKESRWACQHSALKMGIGRQRGL